VFVVKVTVGTLGRVRFRFRTTNPGLQTLDHKPWITSSGLRTGLGLRALDYEPNFDYELCCYPDYKWVLDYKPDVSRWVKGLG
jgi:hypothetical protein